MNGIRPLTGLLRIFGQIGTITTLLAGATAIYTVLSGGSTSAGTGAAWLIIGAIGLAISLWAIIGTASYERFGESSTTTKLIALVSAIAGLLMIGSFIVLR